VLVFQDQPVAAWQIEKVARNFVRNTAARFYRSLDRAVVLSEFSLFYGDPGLINSFAAKLYSVRGADVQRAARAYWAEANRTVVVTVPASASR
jgi:predicted Zn-dependent peptidase